MNAPRPVLTAMFAAVLPALAACEPAAPPDYYTGYVEAELTYVAAPDAGWSSCRCTKAPS